MFQFIHTEKDFLNKTQIAQVLRPTDKQNLMKLKPFCIARDLIIWIKRWSSEWHKKNIYQPHIQQRVSV